MMSYSIESHKHRFAAWAASRAATVNGCRFKVFEGQKIIELSGLMEIGENINNLPNPNEFDVYHREWRYILIDQAEKYQLPFTHGIAAKLINIYLKSIYVCGLALATFLQVGFYIRPMQDNMYYDHKHEYEPNPLMKRNKKVSYSH